MTQAVAGRAASSELTDLLRSLRAQREHVLGILDQLSDEALLRPVLPTGWSCASLVQHLALDVERFWFRQVMAGEQVPTDEFGDDGWQLAPGVTPAAVLALYQAETARADEIITATPADRPPAWWPDFFGDFRLDSLRQVLLHVITETACHAGHLDAARELTDGRTWMVLP